ncbi:hypothetical protein PENTCL1PPCAC_8043, partial [Pristionchus entomophagus]
VEGDVVNRFMQLCDRFNRCDKKRLVQQTSGLFTERNSKRMCALCNVKIASPNSFVMHICGRKHIFAMQGAACADAFDFWWNAVETVGEKSNPKPE